MCDPWADKVYALSEFDKMQQPENDVKNRLSRASTHYLAAPLRVSPRYVGLPIN